MIRKKQDTDGKIGQERWLLTYADMITLLLALFIVMYSMSKLDADKFGNVARAFADQLKGGRSIFEKSLGSDFIGKHVLNLKELQTLEKRLVSRIRIEGLRRGSPLGISTVMDQRGLVIHIKESTLFDPGKDKLKEKAFDALNIVAMQLKDLNNPIRIEGHTDNMPISTARFPSNWELSAARAISVVRYFINEHDFSPDQLSVLGFGEFRPIADNSTAEGRAANRRVDIVVLSQAEIIKEPPAADPTYVEIHEDPDE